MDRRAARVARRAQRGGAGRRSPRSRGCRTDGRAAPSRRSGRRRRGGWRRTSCARRAPRRGARDRTAAARAGPCWCAIQASANCSMLPETITQQHGRQRQAQQPREAVLPRIAVHVVAAVRDDDQADERDQAEHRGAEAVEVDADADAGGAERAASESHRRRRYGRDDAASDKWRSRRRPRGGARRAGARPLRGRQQRRRQAERERAELRRTRRVGESISVISVVHSGIACCAPRLRGFTRHRHDRRKSRRSTRPGVRDGAASASAPNARFEVAARRGMRRPTAAPGGRPPFGRAPRHRIDAGRSGAPRFERRSRDAARCAPKRLRGRDDAAREGDPLVRRQLPARARRSCAPGGERGGQAGEERVRLRPARPRRCRRARGGSDRPSSTRSLLGSSGATPGDARIDPGDALAFAAVRRAVPSVDDEKVQPHALGRKAIVVGRPRRQRTRADADFFQQFARGGLLRRLAGIDLAAGQLPVARRDLARGALREQHAAVAGARRCTAATSTAGAVVTPRPPGRQRRRRGARTRPPPRPARCRRHRTPSR